MKKDLVVGKSLVEKFLKESNEARGDDKILMIMVWQFQGLKLTQEQVDYFRVHCLSPESIRRNRQLIQEEGRWRPTNPQGRLFEEEKVKDYVRIYGD